MDRTQQIFVDRMGHAAETNGLSPIAGRLFAMLLLSDAPRSLDDIAASLDVSKASVSTEARRLLERGVIERVRRAGDRRDYYELAPDFFAQIVQRRVEQWRRIQALVTTMRETSSTLPPVVRERFASIDEIHAEVVDRIDAALADWRSRARKRSLTAAPRRRRTA
ncbi:MAG: GbsR/MarR family transcriptional regulator [Deltaproteobacteria bacterium]